MTAGIADLSEFFLLLFRHDAVLILEDKVMTADDGLLSFDRTGDAVGDDVLHPRMALLMEELSVLRFLYDRIGNRMGIMFFQARRKPQSFRLFISVEGDDFRNRRS